MFYNKKQKNFMDDGLPFIIVGLMIRLIFSFYCSFKRRIIPDVAFTSDFIVGFCGETDKDFNATVSLVQAVGYHKCFMYPYSMR
jgi:hypothetical protein